jgi:hypothetical protein
LERYTKGGIDIEPFAGIPGFLIKVLKSGGEIFS